MTEHKHEYMKKYRAEHKDSIKENQKKYYLSHKELAGVSNSMPSLHLVKYFIHSLKNLYEQEDRKNKCQ